VPAPPADEAWLHELRNAVNTASVAAALLRRSLERDPVADALELVGELERACACCSALVRDAARRPS